MIYLFIIYTKFLNMMSGQTWCLKVENISLFRTEGVHILPSTYTTNAIYKKIIRTSNLILSI